MPLIRLIRSDASGKPVFVNPDQVVSVTAYSDAVTEIFTTAAQNGGSRLTVTGSAADIAEAISAGLRRAGAP